MMDAIYQPENRDSPSSAFQQRAFKALLSLSEAIDEQLTVTQFFERAVEVVCEATGFDSVGMRIYVPETNCFRLLEHRGMSQAMVNELACIPADRGFQAEVLRTKEPAVTSDLAADPRLGGESPLEMGFRSLACVPLLGNGEVMGAMELATTANYEWSPEKINWLSLVGRSVGVFLHQVQLSSRLRDRAVMKERSLIAREIHDGLAQQIGSIFVWAEDAQYAIQERDTDGVKVALGKIELNARDAYSQLREDMLGLREIPAPGECFVVYLQKVLERFRQQWAIETQLVVAAAGGGQALPALIAPAAEIQLLRILQEILTNVRRHAHASTVCLEVGEEDGWLTVHVEDDGCGFDPQQIKARHLGLAIMRERAESVGGRISIETAPGQGVRMQIKLPPGSER